MHSSCGSTHLQVTVLKWPCQHSVTSGVKVAGVLGCRGHVDSVNEVCWQPFSSSLCTASSDKTVSIWDARSGLCTQTFYGHHNSCNCVAFNCQVRPHIFQSVLLYKPVRLQSRHCQGFELMDCAHAASTRAHTWLLSSMGVWDNSAILAGCTPQ